MPSKTKTDWNQISDTFSTEHIGATLLNEVARVMYRPDEVIREYVQNAVDAHREFTARYRVPVNDAIHLEIRKNALWIYDYGAGMNEERISDAKGIFVTTKDKVGAKLGVSFTGYKGIGIWAGLNYFRRLRIESTAKGDSNIYCLELEFKKIVDAINRAPHIGAVLDPHFRLLQKEGDRNDHYTIVALEEPLIEADFFQDKDAIKRAIAKYCPCRIDPRFELGDAVAEFYEKHGLETFDIRVEGEDVYRTFHRSVSDFRTSKLTIDDKDFAVYWLAINPAAESLKVRKNDRDEPVTGVRIVQDGFQIGERNLYSEKHRDHFDSIDGRGTYPDWYVGEVHIIDRKVRPDIRRRELDVDLAAEKAIRRLRRFYLEDVVNYARRRTERDSIADKYHEYEKLLSQPAETINMELFQKAYSDIETNVKLVSGKGQRVIRGEALKMKTADGKMLSSWTLDLSKKAARVRRKLGLPKKPTQLALDDDMPDQGNTEAEQDQGVETESNQAKEDFAASANGEVPNNGREPDILSPVQIVTSASSILAVILRQYKIEVDLVQQISDKFTRALRDLFRL
jgi:hypothetical protein